MRPPLLRRSPLVAPPTRPVLSRAAPTNDAPPPPPPLPPPSPAVTDAARRAFSQVDDLMAEVAREVWVDSAVDAIMASEREREGGAAAAAFDDASSSLAAAEAAAIERVATSRVRGADAALLAALGVAADAAADASDDVSARRLSGLRRALLDAAAASLPPETRVLEAAVQAGSSGDRKRVVEEAVRKGGDDVTAASLFSAASQLIDDLEGHTVVPDTRLLARLVLAREDVRRACADDGEVRAAVSAHAAAIHSGAAQLARDIVGARGDERRAMVERAVRKAPLMGSTTPSSCSCRTGMVRGGGRLRGTTETCWTFPSSKIMRRRSSVLPPSEKLNE